MGSLCSSGPHSACTRGEGRGVTNHKAAVMGSLQAALVGTQAEQDIEGSAW